MVKRKGGVVLAQKPKGKRARKEELLEERPDAADADTAPVPAPGPATSSKKKKRRSKGAKVLVADGVASESEAEKEKVVTPELVRPVGSNSITAPSHEALVPQSPLDATGGEAAEVLEWLLWPLPRKDFFANKWEKLPVHVNRGRRAHYGNLFSKAFFDDLVGSNTPVPYGERVNALRFNEKNNCREDLNKGNRGSLATAAELEDLWKKGASLQVLHPQHVHTSVWKLVAALENAIGSPVGVNAYMTPAGKQGLPPHFDDTEVFILQLEGSMHWRCHAPPAGEEYPLPRESSRDFQVNELGELMLEARLQPGDLLYLPRGIVNYGVAESTTPFSHHLTVSTYQSTGWYRLLDKVMSTAIGRAAQASEDYRAGLPVGFLEYMGNWHDGTNEDERRRAFIRQFQALAKRLHDFTDLDEACDELGIDFMTQRAPPTVTSSTPEDDKKVTTDSQVRFRDVNALRPMLGTDPETSDTTVMLFHSFGNIREEHMNRPIDDEDAGCLHFAASSFLPAIRKLMTSGSSYIRCGDLPINDDNDKIALVENLLENGLLDVA